MRRIGLPQLRVVVGGVVRVQSGEPVCRCWRMESGPGCGGTATSVAHPQYNSTNQSIRKQKTERPRGNHQVCSVQTGGRGPAWLELLL